MPEGNEFRDRVQRVLDSTEIINIRVLEFSGKRVSDLDVSHVNFSSETSYFVSETAFANKFDWSAELLSEDDQEVAQMNATLVVEYDVGSEFEPDREAAEKVAETTGYFAAYPYMRELFQSCCTRLQLNPLVLGMLIRGSEKPRRISGVR